MRKPKNNKKEIVERVRDLRNNATESEKLLWQFIKNRRLGGYRFMRQRPIIYNEIMGQKEYYIADFYCAEKRLIIELDGIIHESQKDYDTERENTLKSLDFKILRIKNEELHNINQVKKKILDACEK
jgi:very-short-patch-repair endonuclease